MVLATRNILMDGKAPPPSLMLNLVTVAAVTLGLGLLIFGRLKRRFYEHL